MKLFTRNSIRSLSSRVLQFNGNVALIIIQLRVYSTHGVDLLGGNDNEMGRLVRHSRERLLHTFYCTYAAIL